MNVVAGEHDGITLESLPSIQPEPHRTQPLLSIAIPTYNRASCLRLLLENLAPQLIGEQRVEVIVSDNASTDDTATVVTQFQRAGLPLNYVRNSGNLGADANILQCFSLAFGKYVWVVGDDDVIVPGALSQVLDLLQAKDYSLVYLSSFGFRDEFTPPSPRPGALSCIECRTPESLVRRVHINLTFISGNIVNKAALPSVATLNLNPLVGSNLVQLGWIFAALENHGKSLIIRDMLVAAKAENTGDYKLCQTFGKNLDSIVRERLSCPRIRRIILNSSIQKLLPPFLFKTRLAGNAFASESPHGALAPVFRTNVRYWFFAFPVLTLPRNLAKSWLLVCRAVNRIDRYLGLPLLS
jgi:abequosyltransferase